jgi:WD40 repeat protein/serine/threonine protein kinase
MKEVAKPENSGDEIQDTPLTIEGCGMRIASYELLELIGEGGMGLVYLAEQQEPVKRKVALKIVKLGMDTKQVVTRFEAERQTLAILEHPNIAHVFDAGTTETGRPYFVMEYVEGKSITKYCDEQKLNIEQRLELFREVCEGVHHAHQKGIIHRDIKPSNILVSIHGDRAVPKIIDFGIAKAITQPLTEKTSYTEQGQLLGTPEYMSPEQAEMLYQDVDTRSDIYSLGVLLYELLSGVPPFDAKGLREGGIDHIQQVICKEEPRTPSARLTSLGDKAKVIAESRRTQIITLTRRLHRELEWIPMKAMRKDRTRRYRSASELADDIQNYLTGTPLIAGPESTVYRARKFVRKHAGSVATAALLFVVIISGLVASILLGCRAEQAREKEAAARIQVEQALARAEKAEKVAEERAEDYRRSLYFNCIALADISYRDGSIRRLRELLEECPEDLRGWEWYRLNHISDQSCMTLRGHNGWELAVSPDGKRIASGSLDNAIKVWDAVTGAELMILRGHDARVTTVAFDSKGKRIVSAAYDGKIKLWDLASVKELMTLKGHEGAAGALFSPDGKRVISGGHDKTIKVWDAETGAELRTLHGHEEPALCHAVSLDGRRIISGGRDKTIRVWDSATGAEVMTLRGHQEYVNGVSFSPDGTRIVSGSWDSTIKVWDTASGEELMTLRGHKGVIYDVTFSPDGKHIISAGRDRTIRLWDAATGTELKILRGHERGVTCVTFNPLNGQVVSCSGDETIKVWDLAIDRKNVHVTDKRTVVALSPDGKWIASGDGMGITTIWNRSTCTELMTLHGPKGDMVAHLPFSPDGKRIFSCHIRRGTIWDIESGTELMSFSGHAGYVYGTFSSNGRYIASWISEYWDEGHDDNTIKLRDAATGKEIMTLSGHEGEVWCVVFSPDSKRLVSCDIDGTIKVWDALTGEEMMALRHKGGTFSVAFSPDGSRIASGGVDKTIRLWDAQTGAEVMTLRGHDGGIASIAFSPDEKRIVSGSRDRTLKLWDAVTGTQVMTLHEEPGDSWVLPQVEFSPDGKTIAVGSFGGIALLESEVPSGGYEPRLAGAAAQKLVDKLRDELSLYSKVIEKLDADETIEEPIRKVALQIANARLWEDEKKTD